MKPNDFTPSVLHNIARVLALGGSDLGAQRIEELANQEDISKLSEKEVHDILGDRGDLWKERVTLKHGDKTVTFLGGSYRSNANWDMMPQMGIPKGLHYKFSGIDDRYLDAVYDRNWEALLADHNVRGSFLAGEGDFQAYVLLSDYYATMWSSKPQPECEFDATEVAGVSIS